jgi:hypothetical protein
MLLLRPKPPLTHNPAILVCLVTKLFKSSSKSEKFFVTAVKDLNMSPVLKKLIFIPHAGHQALGM